MAIFNPLRIGVDAEMPVDQRRRVVFSNAMYLVLGSILLLYICISLPRLIRSGMGNIVQWVPIIMLVISLVCLLLNHYKKYLLSRVVLPLGWIGLVILLPVIYVGPSKPVYFHHVYYSILFSPVVQLFFSYRKERSYFIFFFVAFFLLTVTSFDFLLAFDRSAEPQVPLVQSTFGLRMFHFMFWLFLNLVMMYVLRINEKLYQELEEKNRLIFAQNCELDAQRNRLHQSNEELEKRVAARTHDLELQNKKLTEYAFFHAHILRAPISRIRGLIQLLTLTTDAQEEKKVRGLLNESVEELENAARSINEKLEQTTRG